MEEAGECGLKIDCTYLSFSLLLNYADSVSEPGISGLEKAALPGELEFCSRSN